MPITKSAKKALRQSKRRRLRNLVTLKRLKNIIKKFENKPSEVNFNQVQSVVDLAAKKKVISKNRAARIKNKLSKILPKTHKKTEQKEKTKPKKPKGGKSVTKLGVDKKETN